MAEYNHLTTVGAIVTELYKIPTKVGTSTNIQISASAAQKMEYRVGAEDFTTYTSLIQELLDMGATGQDYFDTINAKEYMFQSSKEKVITSCHRAEARLYAYYLIDKLKKMQNNTVSNDRQSAGEGSLSPSKIDKLYEMKDEILDSAYEILDSINFDIDNPTIEGASNVWIFGTKTVDLVIDLYEEEEAEDE